MPRERVSTGTIWEPVVGYSRAIRVGATIHVSGTTAVDESGEVVGAGDPYLQSRQILRRIAAALEALGGSLNDVVRTRTYVTDIGSWREVGRAHGEVFGEIRPATSMVQVAALIDPAFLVEIEAEAIVESSGGGPAEPDQP